MGSDMQGTPRWLIAAADAMSAIGVTPNAITWLSLVASVAGGASLALGAGDALPWSAKASASSTTFWPLLAAGFVLLAGLFDMFDGMVARRTATATPAGALLDSTLDRLGELALFAGCAAHFAIRGNATLVLLSVLAFGAGSSISYIKARAENFVDGCGVGFFGRAERIVVLIGGAATGCVPAALWVLTIGPALTAWRRFRHASSLLRALPPPPAQKRSVPQPSALDRLAIWRQPRGSIGYIVTLAMTIGFVLILPRVSSIFTVEADPIGDLMHRWR